MIFQSAINKYLYFKYFYTIFIEEYEIFLIITKIAVLSIFSFLLIFHIEFFRRSRITS